MAGPAQQFDLPGRLDQPGLLQGFSYIHEL
jgi:hypothetical protein